MDTDGRLLVAARYEHLDVVDVSTDQPRLLGRLPLPSGARGSFVSLAGNRAVVLTPGDTEDFPYGSLGPAGVFDPTTEITLIDLTDPARPRMLAGESTTAHAVAMTRTGARIRIVLDTVIYHRVADPSRARRAGAAAWLPDRQIRDARGRLVAQGALVPCTSVYRTGSYSGHDLLTVLTIDPTRDDALVSPGSTMVLTGSEAVALSDDRLFVATVPGWGSDEPAPRRGKPVVLPANPHTDVHAFSLAADGVRYLASAAVSAYPVGPRAEADAMSARGTTVRMLTSRVPPWWSRYLHNRADDDVGVAVLPEVGGAPQLAGAVHGLARGKTPEVVRWFDDVVALAPALPGHQYWAEPPVGRLDVVSLGVPPTRVGQLDFPVHRPVFVPIGGGRILGSGRRALAASGPYSSELTTVQVDETGVRHLESVSLGGGEVGDPLWLPQQGTVVIPANPSFGTPCQVDMPCLAVPPPCDLPPPLGEEYQGASVLLAVRPAGDGRLEPVSCFRPRRWIGQVIPLRGRLLVVGEDVTVLDPDGLRPLGSAQWPS